MAQKVLVIGGSRNIGYYSAIGFLQSGATVTFLLRSPAVFDADKVVQEYVKSGKARLIKGDALVQQDVKRAWEEAAAGEGEHVVDLLIFTVGGTPKFSATKGFIITPANLVTQSFLNTVCTLPRSETLPQTKIIAITSMGISRSSHASLPFLLKPLYSHFLELPHEDKRGAERVLAHCAGWEWNAEDEGEPSEEILGDWTHREGLPESGTLKKILVVRPALLTDGERKAGKKGKDTGYKVSEQELGGWTVSRKDVAHFVVEAGTQRWADYEGKRVNISY